MLYKWNHTVCDLLRLAFSLSMMPLRCTQIALVSIVHSFLLLSSIPWCGWMSYGLFNHSPTEEHLGCFQFGEIYFIISFSIYKVYISINMKYTQFLFLSFLWFFWPCHVASGILVPRPGIETSPALGVWSLNHWTTREVPLFFS